MDLGRGGQVPQRFAYPGGGAGLCPTSAASKNGEDRGGSQVQLIDSIRTLQWSRSRRVQKIRLSREVGIG